MSFSMTTLLIHSQSVPTRAREALESAESAGPEHRDRLLESAARILHAETDLECADVLELVGLPSGRGCV